MCGRYFLNADGGLEAYSDIVGRLNRTDGAEVKTAGEVFPSDVVPVIANNRRLSASVFPMKWGYSTPDGRLVFNARSETAAQKPMFREGMAQRRCVVPASWYFEWERVGRDRRKYAIRPADGAMTYMAGIYRIEDGRAAFAILTRPPAGNIRFIHDRMPVLLPEAMIADWLDPRRDAAGLLAEADPSVRFEPASDAPEQLRLF